MSSEHNKSHLTINFELYKIFYYCAEELSFSKAAVILHVTQSAISQAIKSLETQLGVNLFFRQGRNIRLTFEGEMLYSHIQKAYHFIKSGENAIHSIKSLDEGTVFIGASDTITRHFLISQIKAFHRLYPKVKLSITNRPSPQSVEKLKNGEIDLAIINLDPSAHYEGLEVYPLTQVENVFICSPERTALYTSTHSLDFLSQFPLICLEEKSTTRKVLEDFYESQHIELDPAFEFGSLDVILESVKADMGIGFVSRNSIDEALEAGEVKIIPVKETISGIMVAILLSKNKPLSMAAQKFFELLTFSDI